MVYRHTIIPNDSHKNLPDDVMLGEHVIFQSPQSCEPLTTGMALLSSSNSLGSSLPAPKLERTLLMLGPSRLSTTKVLTPSSATHLLAIINPLVDHVIAQTEKNQLVTLISPNHTTPSHRRGPLGHLLQTPGSFNPLGAKVSPCPYRQAIMNIMKH